MYQTFLVACAASEPGVPTGMSQTADSVAPTSAATTTSTSVWADPVLQQTYCVDATGITAVVEGDGFRVSTPHFDLWLSGSEQLRAEEIGRLAEASWLAHGAYFEAEPDPSELPLVGSMYASREAFEEAIVADGLAIPEDAAGYYHPSTKKVYLSVQPTRYYENSLLLHEWMHQFHYLSRTGNQDVPHWYAEGLAEYLSRHDWDGECLRLGVIPMISQEDFYAKARQDVDDLGVGLGGWMAGTDSFTRPRAMAVVGWLERYENQAFAAIRAHVDGGGNAQEGFDAHLPDTDQVEAQVDAWIHQVEEPLTPRFIQWLHIGTGSVMGLQANSYFSAAELKSGEALTATVLAPPIGHLGVLIAWDGPNDHMAVLRDAQGNFSIWEANDGAITWDGVTAVGTGPDSSLAFDVSVYHDAAGAVATFGDAEVPVLVTQRAATGLATYGSVALFTDLRRGK